MEDEKISPPMPEFPQAAPVVPQEVQNIPQEAPVAPQAAPVAAPIQNVPQVPTRTFEEEEIERLEDENNAKQNTLDQRRKIQTLKAKSQQLDEAEKLLKPKFKFDKSKAKFYAIAATVSIFGAIILVKVVQKFI